MWQEEMICPKSHIHQWQSYKSWSPDLRIFTLSPSTCPKFEPGLGELVLSQPQWVWGSWSFIWFLSSGVWPGACHLCCWSFCEQSLALHSLWAWHLWHLASWTLKRLSSLNMLWGLVQDELGWEAVNGGSGAALLCPSLPGVTQSGSQCQEMWHWHQLTLVDVFIRTWSSAWEGHTGAFWPVTLAGPVISVKDGGSLFYSRDGCGSETWTKVIIIIATTDSHWSSGKVLGRTMVVKHFSVTEILIRIKDYAEPQYLG